MITPTEKPKTQNEIKMNIPESNKLHMNNYDIAENLPAESWWRQLCEVSPGIYVSGDLHHDKTCAEKQLDKWRKEELTHIVDCREEWNDSKIVKHYAPEITYWHIGTHDNGGVQEFDWFDKGTDLIEEALLVPNSKILIHCHMGVNRAPSMAFAALLRSGKGIVESLDAIRSARPIAAIMYAESALIWHGLKNNWSHKDIESGIREIHAWHRNNRIDIGWIISRIRSNEQVVV